MNFLAIDVETANADYSSICQIGVAEFENGQVIQKWSTLVNPEAYFDPFNVSIHGIDKQQVKDAPTFDKIHNELISRIQDKITVHHMPFDKIAISRACQEYNLEIINAIWLDSAKIARRTWEQFAYKGYGLANIANHLKIEFMHHDALEDAITAGKIVIEACTLKNLMVEHWLEQIRKPINPGNIGYSFNQLNANADGPLYRELLVFTGALFLPRNEAAKIAADLGCEVGNSISTKTTMLVVGTQDSSKLAGYEKSSKHRKVEELINKGFPIKILSEKDFIEICNSANNCKT
jgi:DNA polymerase III subunit epsilon